MTDLTKQQILTALRDGCLTVSAAREALRIATGAAVPCPLSEMQLGIWSLQNLAPGMSAYNIPIAFVRRGPLDLPVLQQACQDLVEKFPILRSIIRKQEDEAPVRLLLANAAPAVTSTPVGHASDAEIDELARRSKDQPFDLATGPLWRLHVFVRAEKDPVLLLTIHHIIYDGAVALPLVDALLGFYDVRAAGATPTIVAQTAAYDDFVREERRWLDSAAAQRELAFWSEHLAQPLTVLDLPLDKRRPPEQTFEGGVVARAVPAALTAKVRESASKLGVSPSAFFLATFKLLLFRYSRQADIVVGVPTTRRLERRFDDVIGHFVNLLPLRSGLAGDKIFSTLAREVQTTLLAGRHHAGIPFPALVRALSLPRVPGSTPVFQAVFAYQKLHKPAAEQALASKRGARLLTSVHQEGESELGLEVFERGEGIALHFKFNAGLFERATAARMLDHFLHLTDQVASTPDKPLDEYALLTTVERELIVSRWNQTAAAYPSDLCLHEWIASQIETSPEAEAVRHNRATLSYRELGQRSDALATFLHQHGVAPGALVGVCLERSLDLLVTLLGVMKTGAAYVPMDPEYPSERLRHIVEGSRAAVVLTQSSLESLVRATVAPETTVLLVDRPFPDTGTPGAAPAPSHRVRPTDLAYVIYTSGSTGKPKGVMIPHRALTNLLAAMARTPGMRAGDRMLALASFAFDMSVPELYLPLVTGGTCILCDSASARDPQRLMEEIGRHRPTLMQATPTTCSMLLQAGWQNHEGVVVLCGAEPLTPPLKEQLLARGVPLWNMYGPTETTVWSTAVAISKDEPLSIGRPIANTRVYILDARGEPQPVGIPGELYIGGDGVADGYFGQPGLTAERFVSDPFTGAGRLYRTGDLARWLPNGCIEFIGRNDYQVKIRGFRIELEEIESRLKRHPAVADAMVVVNEQEGIKRLVAYVVPTAIGDQLPDLRKHLEAHLPTYMVPAFYVALDKIPLTANGKADRKGLMARPLAGQDTVATTAPGDDVEGQLAQIWQRQLKIDLVSLDGGFFDVGGDSVLAVGLADQISRRFGVTFSVTSLFKHATIREQSRHIAELRASLPPVASAPATDPVTPVAPPATAAAPDAPGAHGPEGVAIIGMSLQVPGSADVRAFWANLRAGNEGLRRQPSHQARAGQDGLTNGPVVEVTGSIPDKAHFDPEFFGISSHDAELMDPQLRHLMQHAWNAVEDAGYTPAQIPDTSVFVAASHSLYRALVTGGPPEGPVVMEDATDYVSWILAQGGTIPTMISHKLGFEGPSVFVHTNCSSSLTALSSACQSILSGESQQALVGAATLFASSTVGYVHQPGLNFSGDGRIKAFDADADGMVPAEGVAAVLLKRARAAVADGDHIYAVIRAVALNNDGANKAGFYAPSVRGQADVIEKALRRAAVDPDTMAYVEAHGTGTRIGDPIEVAALTEVYRKFSARRQYCGLGTVKTNVGHLDTVAGLAGLIKVALSLYHEEIPPTLHYQRANPALNLEESPFYVVDRLTSLRGRPGPLRAALSSFGVGGTNAHAIVERHPTAAQRTTVAAGPQLVPLSAKTADRLRARARRLADLLATGAPIELEDLAFTLTHGRVAMESRACFVVESLAELRTKLEAFAAGAAGAASFAHQDERNSDDFSKHTLARRWAAGHEIAWPDQAASGRRISLPGYPFAADRYWPAARSGVPREIPIAGPAAVASASSDEAPHFRVRFDGSEFFLTDHVVGGNRILPGVVYLELARTALARVGAAPGGPTGRVVLEHVAWIRPLVVDAAAVSVEVALTETSPARFAFEISSTRAAEPQVRTVHCQGHAVLAAPIERPSIDLASLRRDVATLVLAAEDCYALYRRLGIHYGPGHRGIRAIWSGNAGVLAHLELPATVSSTISDFVVHPSLLDSAFQAAVGVALQGGQDPAQLGAPPVPFALERLEIHAACGPVAWAHLVSTSSPSREGLRRIDLVLCDDQGRVCLEAVGLTARTLRPRPAEPDALQALAFATTWRPLPDVGAAAGVRRDGPVLIAGATAIPAARPEGSWITLAGDTGDPAGDFLQQSLQLFSHLQRAAGATPKQPAHVRLVLVGATSHLAAGFVPMLRTARLENPAIVGQCIELPAGSAADTIEAALATADRHPNVVHLRGRGSSYERAVLQELTAPPATPGQPWKDRGVYLITGGAGRIGQVLADAIARSVAAPRLILVGRSPAPRPDTLRRLTDLGAQATYRAADVADRHAVDALVKDIVAQHGSLDGVLHCAGVLQDQYILRKDRDSFAEVYAAKVAGAVNLDRATANLALDLFVLFSSASAYLGNPGQVDYAAANGFLDALAVTRRDLVAGGQRKGCTLAIAWPLWADGGMTIEAASAARLREDLGMVPMPSDTALQILARALAGTRPTQLILYGPPHEIRAALAGRERDSNAEHVALTESPAIPPGEGLVARTEAWLKQLVSGILRTPVAKLDVDAPLERYGIDSIIVVKLNNELERHFGALSKTLFFEYQTLAAVAGYFMAHHGAELTRILAPSLPPPRPLPPLPAGAPTTATAPGPLPAPTRPQHTSTTDDPMAIAIVGVAGRYPGANSLDQFWANLRAGKDCITEVPTDRWDHDRYFDPDKNAEGKTYTKWGGFIDGVADFDPTFFNISPREAAILDPQERLFLETAYEALQDAGYTRQSLSRRQGGKTANVGVFVGVMYQEYQLYGAQATALGRPTALPSSPSSIANRVSYFCDFHGPSMGVDTMCSSSLTAIRLACQSLRDGECAAALAGGVNISIHLNKYLLLALGRFASSKGRCESFGDGGDGYVPGEGVGAVLLKRLADAEADGDHIYGVIRSIVTNHGGRTNGFSVPNPQAQSDAIARALELSRIPARAIGYVEAHGTGTSLGDPIEIAGLSRPYRQHTSDKQFCAIGSVKSNIGHCESAAGVAALTKVLLQLKHQWLVPSLHADTLNRNIDFASSPFYVQREGAHWARPTIEVEGVARTYPRIAGISSFGAGGSNAHMLIEEHTPHIPDDGPPNGPHAILLSARTEAQLRRSVERLLDRLRAEDWNDSHLPRIAYTLQVGREAFDHRLALVVDTLALLVGGLEEFLADRLSPGLAVFQGKVNSQDDSLRLLGREADFQALIARRLQERRFEAVLPLWTRGLEIDWQVIYGGAGSDRARPRRISLPTYPFERKRYWGVPALEGLSAPAATATSGFDTGEGKGTLPAPMGKLSAPLFIPVASSPTMPPARRTDRQITLAAPSALAAPPPSDTIAAAAGATGAALVAKALRQSLASALMLDEAEIDLDRPFVELGLDSIVGVEWVGTINAAHGLSLPATTVYDHPSLRDLSAFVAGLVRTAAPLPPLSEAPTSVVTPATAKPAAVALVPLASAPRPIAMSTSPAAGRFEERSRPSPDAQEAAGAQAAATSLLPVLIEELGRVLLLASSEIDVDRPFTDLGLDSILGVEWTNALNRRFGLQLPATVIYDHPTIRQLAEHVAALGPVSPTPANVASAAVSSPSALSLEHLLEQVEAGAIDVDTASALFAGSGSARSAPPADQIN
jgi:polyketide synthase PksJ